MGLAAIAALVIAASPDAGAELPPAVYADRAQLELDLPDGGVARFPGQCFTDVDGGSSCSGGWLPTPRLEAHGGEVARLRTENVMLKAVTPLFSPTTWFFIGLVAALFALGGFVGGFEVEKLFGH